MTHRYSPTTCASCAGHAAKYGKFSLADHALTETVNLADANAQAQGNFMLPLAPPPATTALPDRTRAKHWRDQGDPVSAVVRAHQPRPRESFPAAEADYPGPPVTSTRIRPSDEEDDE